MPIAKIGQLAGQNKNRSTIAIIFSVIIAASVLMVYPLSYTASGWRPLFMLMVDFVLGAWGSQRGVASGWPLVQDCYSLLLNAPLGMNALSFVVITFVARFLDSRAPYYDVCEFIGSSVQSQFWHTSP